jgi:excisionase family DNA binding protein
MSQAIAYSQKPPNNLSPEEVASEEVRNSDLVTWWTVTNVAEYLQCSEDHIRKLVRNDELPAAYVAGRYLFQPKQIEHWLTTRIGKKPRKGSRHSMEVSGEES